MILKLKNIKKNLFLLALAPCKEFVAPKDQ
jgi:hypothetical protein